MSHRRNTDQLDIQLWELALSSYNPCDEISHKVTLSLIAWASAFIASRTRGNISWTVFPITAAIKPLFATPTSENQTTGAIGTRGDEVEEAAVDFVSGVFIDMESKNLIDPAYSLLNYLPLLTLYVETLRRRHDRGHSHAIGKKVFAALVTHLHDWRGAYDHEETKRFRKAVALFPQAIEEISEGVREWVVEALEGEAQAVGPDAPPSQVGPFESG